MASVAIEVELLSGRYHAHVWGESQFAMGEPEWPPSPWRLLRAIAASWFAARPAPCSPQERDRLLELLGGSEPPVLLVPRTAFKELRYYQPVWDSGRGRKPAAHHDHFAVPAGGRFYFVFETNRDLTSDQRDFLDKLLRGIRYLGRSESRAALRVVDSVGRDGLYSALPRKPTGEIGNYTIRRVLCPSAELGFKARDLWELRQMATPTRGRRRGSGVATAGGHPLHLVEALLDAKKPLPDGCRWTEYTLPREALVREIPARIKPSQQAPRQIAVYAVRFRLCRRVPIPLSDTVHIARAFRDEAVRQFEVRSGGQNSVTLSGRNPDGSVETGNQHAYYLPRPAPGARHIEDLLVRIPTAVLSEMELDSLLAVRNLLRDDPYPLLVVPEAVIQEPTASEIELHKRWVSVTPFLSPLFHRRGRQRTLVEEQLIRTLAERYGLKQVTVQRSAAPGSVLGVRAHLYDDAVPHLTRRIAHMMEICLDVPVVLPYPLGADAHFGLGQFRPAEGRAGPNA
jgi:CRISPR-associated protein Csb2